MGVLFQTGQRWVSESEPELGLGCVTDCTDRTVNVLYSASGERRQYAAEHAPLRRVRFRLGDKVTLQNGTSILVQAVREQSGLIYYQDGTRELPETELSDRASLNEPQERWRAGQVDPPEAFHLRWAALEHQHRRRQSRVRGLVGGRIELMPHQLYIAPEVAGRLLPRVLLADEVGLGKTIEACLILHRLIQTGRARRVLILVPETLVHQWFVELLRRFNLWFHIYDEDRCEAIETGPEVNPFLDDQLVLCAINLLAQDGVRVGQALAAGWDLIVVDEAHHLGWAPDAVSPEYAMVEALAGKALGILLLTATPEQLGITSHFARLRLLDPQRYYDLDEFLKEAAHYQEVAAIAQRLIHREKLTLGDITLLTQILPPSNAFEAELRKIEAGDEAARAEWLDDLLDQHGTGRVVFRNTRAVLSGFPTRTARLYRLAPFTSDSQVFDRLAAEFAADNDPLVMAAFQPDFAIDPRIGWLADLLREVPAEKVLLICRTQAKLKAIDDALRRRITVKTALFHEGLSLVQRDRNAAWFAERDGAQILLASEIGSEGRNFQFAHHLVLFDLPLDPELLEQRIGRLDRIGQKQRIYIHVPYLVGSPQEVLALWFHEGLNALATNLRGGHQLMEQFRARVYDLAQDFHETEETTRATLRQLIHDTQSAARQLADRLEKGRDRLLELNSFRPHIASQIIQKIRKEDQDRTLEEFLLLAFDHFGIQVEELAPRTYHLGSAGVFADSFPGLPAEGFTVTLERERALAREDMQFLTWDHPLATGALDLILGSEVGNCSFGWWPDERGQGLYLRAIYLLECIAPAPLHVDRFLPPTPVAVFLDHQGNDASSIASVGQLPQHLRKDEAHPLLQALSQQEELLPTLLAKAESLASSKVPQLIMQARKQMNAQLSHEIARLRELQSVSRMACPEEIELLIAQKQALDMQLAEARLRLDAIQLIARGPAKGR